MSLSEQRRISMVGEELMDLKIYSMHGSNPWGEVFRCSHDVYRQRLAEFVARHPNGRLVCWSTAGFHSTRMIIGCPLPEEENIVGVAKNDGVPMKHQFCEVDDVVLQSQVS